MSFNRRCYTLLLLLFAVLPLSAQTTNNDDACDISVTPAATLLLPYFEAAPWPGGRRTTLFTITNVSALPQIARATIWTNLAYPIYTFDIFLTGYDVTTVNLRDVFATGRFPRPRSSATAGPLSSSNFANPNHHPTMPVDCASRPEAMSEAALFQMLYVLTRGGEYVNRLHCLEAGRTRSMAPGGPGDLTQSPAVFSGLAVGYVTIDVVATCSPLMPNSAEYFLSDLLFDNVLVGDWAILDADDTIGTPADYALGSPLVHIRAVPEGGRAGSAVPTNLPYTFHDRLTNILPPHLPRTFDRRQPLPATFAARYIQWQPDYSQPSYETAFLIWREAVTGSNARCYEYGTNDKGAAEIIRFDEKENATVIGQEFVCTPAPRQSTLPPTSSLSSANTFLPLLYNTADVDTGGWVYFNLSNGGSPAYSTAPGRDFKTGAAVAAACARQSQNWVISAMRAGGRYAVAMDATPLANGCSRAPAAPADIGPGSNVNP